MKVGIIGDLHLTNKYGERYLNAQVQAVWTSLRGIDADEFIFLGDVFDRRRPYADELIAAKHAMSGFEKPIHILRGNHDSQDKSDDGCTSLWLLKRDNLSIVSDMKEIIRNVLAIPHYETVATLWRGIEVAADANLMVGHFSHNRAYWSYETDELPHPNDFKCTTVLGHIHNHSDVLNKRGERVVTMGTPWPTTFSEQYRDGNYYGIFNTVTEELEIKDWTYGGVNFKTFLGVHEFEEYSFEDNRFHIIEILLEEDPPEGLSTFEDEIKAALPNNVSVVNIGRAAPDDLEQSDAPVFDTLDVKSIITEYIASLDLTKDQRDLITHTFTEIENLADSKD